MLGFNGGRLGSKNVIEQNGIVGPSSDPNYDDVGLILNGGDFVDGSKYAATVTATGVDLDASNTNFGNASYSVLDIDTFTVPDQGQFDLSTNDFTIEGWVYRYAVATTHLGIFLEKEEDQQVWFVIFILPFTLATDSFSMEPQTDRLGT